MQKTILVVDDSETVLKLVVTILERANFRIFSANSGPSALLLARQNAEQIDLLLSDVDMPGMSGPALGEIMKQTMPNLRVMLMSGGVDGNLSILDYGWAFIQKPFVPRRLVEMITNVLNSPNPSQSGVVGYDTRKDVGRRGRVGKCGHLAPPQSLAD